MRVTFVAILTLFLAGCSEGPWNNPYPVSQQQSNTIFSSFSERPKHLDPVRSYSSNEYAFIAQIYEPLLQYHFLKRPYELTTLTAAAMPKVRWLDENLQPLTEDADRQPAFTEYRLAIKPGIRYQPHPAFARFSSTAYEYHELSEQQLEHIYQLSDFRHHASRELSVDDYIYQIKRLADKDLHSPIAGVMAEYIVGFSDFQKKLAEHKQANPDVRFYDLREHQMEGVSKISDTEFSIRLKGAYPQFIFWLAMPFFAPMPWEADSFYSQALLKEKNITLDWYPVGTGPFMLSENNPNLRMVLSRNPNFHGETYPIEGEADDKAAGLLDDAGKTLPFIDKAIYSLEKETIPYWNKFLQGYYDASGVSSDSFDQAIQFTAQGDAALTDDMKKQGISLMTAVQASTFYMGFNMLDPVVGGDSDRARLLRQAISIAIDYDEYISIFANGRGMAAQSPIPPGIFGHDNDSFNPMVYFRDANGKVKRRPVEDARALMEKAGYANGIDPETKESLVLYFDVTSSGPDDRARLNWYRKQFAKIGIQLVLRTTDYNRFQEKMRKGTAQIFTWGWNADYPDPENFLFLLYGENSKVNHGGENAANYQSEAFDAMFVKMKNMPNSPERAELIKQMVSLLQQDAPWIWGFHPKAFSLFHQWYKNVKPNLMANNTLKYKKVDPQMRVAKQQQWNQPVVWPMWLILALLVVSILPAIRIYKQHEQRRMK